MYPENIAKHKDLSEAVTVGLQRLGVSWHELVVMAYSGNWATESHRLTWKYIQEVLKMKEKL